MRMGALQVVEGELNSQGRRILAKVTQKEMGTAGTWRQRTPGDQAPAEDLCLPQLIQAMATS